MLVRFIEKSARVSDSRFPTCFLLLAKLDCLGQVSIFDTTSLFCSEGSLALLDGTAQFVIAYPSPSTASIVFVTSRGLYRIVVIVVLRLTEHSIAHICP